jgi:hypothetical protein
MMELSSLLIVEGSWHSEEEELPHRLITFKFAVSLSCASGLIPIKEIANAY